MAITHQDIANLAGVSRGTVDRVLHNRPNVTEIARKKVIAAANALNYKSVDKSDYIIKYKMSILIPRWYDSHFNRKISGGIRRAERYIADNAVEIREVMLETHTMQELISVMFDEVENGANGLIINGENTAQLCTAIDQIVDCGIAVITYDSDIPKSKRLCHIGQDLLLSGGVGAGLVSKLIRPGKHILIVLGNMYLNAHKGRIDGFCTKLHQLGFDRDCYTIIETGELHTLTEDEIYRHLKQNGNIHAIYMATQPISSCIAAIKRANLPHKVHIVSNDLTPSAKQYLRNDMVDFIIGQEFDQESFLAIIAMYRTLKYKKNPEKQIMHTNMSIITKEMV